MTKFGKHIGRGGDIEIDGEKFILKPLGTKYLPEYFQAMKSFGGLKEESSTEDIMKALTSDSIIAIKLLIEATLEKSFPEEWKENEEEVKEFGMKNMMILMPKIFELNSADVSNVEHVKKQQVLDRLNKKPEQ